MRIHFGKYKGEKLEDVFEKDSRYIKWLYKNINLGRELKAGIKKLLNDYDSTDEEYGQEDDVLDFIGF